MGDITQKKIVFFGQDCHLYCDGKCYKAWGLPSRPRVTVGDKEYWVADDEFDYAPDDPGTYEGADGKPMIRSGRDMNKWCARCCERSHIVNDGEKLDKNKLIDWSKRLEINKV